MMQKVVASETFKDQKESYPQSVGRLFLDTRLGKYAYNHSTRIISTDKHELTRCLYFVQSESKSTSKSSRLLAVRKCRWVIC